MNLVIIIVVALVVLKWAAGVWLDLLNRSHVRAHSDQVPDAFKETVDRGTYQKSVDYTLAKNRLSVVESVYDLVVLLLVLLSGVLPWGYGWVGDHWGASIWAAAGYLFGMGILLSLTGLPFRWYSQFRLEERFGFNTSTTGLWCVDRIKGMLIAVALGYPLVVLLLKLAEWTGSWWWLWGWGTFMSFQLLMVVLAPVAIMPLFNKFTPLPEGELRERLLGLGERTGFQARSIQVMDGSRRSRHSNAFFAGFGRVRKIVLFDTLIEQLTPPELEAVLAHEIGHSKKRHIQKMVIWSGAGLLAGFYLLSVLVNQVWLYAAFGFEPGQLAPILMLFVLLSGTVTFWLSPLANHWSRVYEYEADAYAAEIMGETVSLTGALRKLNEKNLSNLTPHPVYSGFYYSHPSLVERERALGGG